MLIVTRAPVSIVVHEHLEDAASLRQTRSILTRAPHVKLHLLRRLDDRIAASLDGLAVAGDVGRRMCLASLETPSRGAVFAAAMSAIEGRDPALLEKLLAVAETSPDARSGLVSAFGWVSAASLRGITSALFNSTHPFRRGIALAACAMHHVDPRSALDAAIADPEARTQAVCVAGKLGRLDLLPACLAGLAQDHVHHQFASARSSLLLGDRWASVQKLGALALVAGPHQVAAAMLVLRLLAAAQANALLKSMAQDATLTRALIRCTGAAGDPHYVPWLIKQMSDLKMARLAGESFSTITGADLAQLDLDLTPPENLELGPNDDPDNEDIAMDEDDSLPWPDPDKIAAWWQSNSHRFAPSTRCFMGAPPSPAHCLSVLKTGFQRQRIAAAEYLSLMKPGTPLFNTAAPAWRQQRWLNNLG